MNQKIWRFRQSGHAATHGRPLRFGGCLAGSYRLPFFLIDSATVADNIGAMQVFSSDNFRANLRTAMRNRGISQRELASRVDGGYTHLNRILTGKSDVTLSSADRLADAIGVPLCDLLSSPSEFDAADSAAVV